MADGWVTITKPPLKFRAGWSVTSFPSLCPFEVMLIKKHLHPVLTVLILISNVHVPFSGFFVENRGRKGPQQNTTKKMYPPSSLFALLA